MQLFDVVAGIDVDDGFDVDAGFDFFAGSNVVGGFDVPTGDVIGDDIGEHFRCGISLKLHVYRFSILVRLIIDRFTNIFTWI